MPESCDDLSIGLSYNDHCGYLMPMSEPKSSRAGKQRTRLQAQTATLGWAGQIRRPQTTARLSSAQQELIITLMQERDGLAGACARANIGLGLVLAERRRNPAFRRALAAAEKQRLALLEMLLTDLVVRGLLASDETPNSDTREKFLSSLAQALLDKSASGKSGSKIATTTKRQNGTAASKTASTGIDRDELSILLAETERRITEAEAELGLDHKNAGKDAE